MPLVLRNPPPFRFTIEGSRENHVRWSELVVAWIRGQEEHPRTLTQLRAQCDDRGIDYSLPPELQEEIIVLQGAPNTMTMRLPAAALFEKGHSLVQNGVTAYAVPNFYLDFFTAEPDGTVVLKELDGATALELHALRTGEYAINGCA